MLRSETLPYLIFPFVILAGPSTLAQGQDTPRCFSSEVSKSTAWVTSGVTIPEQDRLLLVDTGSERVMNVTFTGDLEPAGPVEKVDSGPMVPLQIRSGEDGYMLLQLRFTPDGPMQQIQPVDRDLVPLTEPFAFEKHPLKGPSGAYQVFAVYDFVPLGEGILALADLMNVERPEDSGAAFCYINFQEDAITILYSLEELDEIQPYTLNSFTPYITALDRQTAFILFLDERPVIRRFDLVKSGKLSDLPSFPEDLRHFPRLLSPAQPTPGRRLHKLWYRQLEKTTLGLATGLYAWRGRLFLLGRHGAPIDGDPNWWLVEIDPDTGEELGRNALPTQAAHLSIVLGGDYWTVVERGPVQTFPRTYAPYMSIASMVLIPADSLFRAHTLESAAPDPKAARALCRPFQAR